MVKLPIDKSVIILVTILLLANFLANSTLF
jgi:hypothetical protein